MLDYVRLKSVVEKYNSFVITTHVNPDADAIGSEMALYYLLQKLGKKVSIFNHSKTPYYLEFLDTNRAIRKYNPEDHDEIINESEVIFFLDLNQLDRVRSLRNILSNNSKIKICIDHHQNPEDVFDYQFIDTEYSATGEIIYNFIKETGIIDLDFKIAESLYAAIATDTGSFRFPRTTPKVHRIAAELLEIGVDPTDVHDKIYDQSRPSKIKLLGRAINSMKIDDSQKIAYMIVTQNDMNETGADESEVDGFVNYCLSIENIQIGLLFFELKNGLKISFRSKRDIPINKLAEELGGGGHQNAAGARLFDVKLDDYITRVIDSAKNYLE